MPVGKMKNALYGAALPILGKRPSWRPSSGEGAIAEAEKALFRHNAAGACVQVFREGKLTESLSAGLASEGKPVEKNTVFRTASLAKTVTALLVFRLQTKGLLNVSEDIGRLWGEPIRSPYFPKAPVTLGMLMSHTSGIVDSPAYFASFGNPAEVSGLLAEESAWQPALPGTAFRYSNLAAGLIGCLLEKRFGESLETLAQRELFAPLGVEATFDLAKLSPERCADSWRIMPYARAFDAGRRIASASSMEEPDPEHRYLPAAGGLFLTAEALAKLTLAAWNGADGFLDALSLEEMHSPVADWPEKEIRIRHGMGLFRVEDSSVYPGFLWGHQGIAYGAVNGLFFDEKGTGFTVLTSGASEQRRAHLTRLNLALISALLTGGEA